MLWRLFGGFLLANILLTMVGCSEGTEAVDPGNKPNIPPVTRITPDEQFISNDRVIDFLCSDPNEKDVCSDTFVSKEQGVVPDIEPQFKYDRSIPFTLESLQAGNAQVVEVKYFSVDDKGTKENVNTKSYIVDVEAPLKENVVPSVPAGNYTKAQWISFACQDPEIQPGQEGSGCKWLYYAFTEVNAPVPKEEDYKIELIKDVYLQINQNVDMYFYAEDAAGNKSLLNKYTYMFDGAISKVTNFIATAGNAAVSLAWKNPIDPNFLGVIIKRHSVTPNFEFDDTLAEIVYNGSAESASDPLTLVNGKTYYYRAYAYDNSTPSNYAPSELAQATPEVDPVPTEINNFVATAKNGAITLQWDKSNDSDFSHVVIRRSVSGPVQTIDDGTEIYSGSGDPTANLPTKAEYTDKPVTNGVTLYYRIFAFDMSAQHSAGVSLTATPGDYPPSAVVGLAGVAGEGFVSLSWAKQTDPDNDIKGVTIIRKLDSPPTYSINPNGTVNTDGTPVGGCGGVPANTTCQDTTVENGKTYYYGAYAEDNAKQFSPSLTVAGPFNPVDQTPPGPVTQLSAAPGSGLIVLSWQNPTDVDFAGVLVLRKVQNQVQDCPADPVDNTATQVFKGNGTTITDDNNGGGLLNGTTYCYRVWAYDGTPLYSTTAAQVSAMPLSSDNTSPQVSSTSPADAATGVNPTLPIAATFNEDILSTSVVDGVVSLVTQTGKSISGSVTMPTPNSVSFTPTDGQLPLLTNLTATLTAGITDLSGNPLDPTPQTGAYTWSFTTADGSWDLAPKNINNIFTPWSMESAIAIDKFGNGIAVWQQNNNGVLEIVAKHYNIKTGWEAQTIDISCMLFDPTDNTICLSKEQSKPPEIAMDDFGNAIVVWFQGTSSSVYANRYIKGTGWSLPILLQLTAQSVDPNSDPAVDVDANGTVTVVWSELNTKYDVWAKRFLLTTDEVNWTNSGLPPAELIEWDDINDAVRAQLAVDDNGNALVIWWQRDIATNGIPNVRYNYFHSSGPGIAPNWDQPSPPDNLPHPKISNSIFTNDLSNHKIAINSITGDAIAVWCRRDENAVPSVSVLWANHFDSGTASWGGEQPISDVGTSATTAPYCGLVGDVNIAMHTDGSAIVTWPLSTTHEAHANRYDPVSKKWLGDIVFSSFSLYEGGIVMDEMGNSLAILRGQSGSVGAHRFIYGELWDTATINNLKNETLIGYSVVNTVSSLPNIAVQPGGNAVALWTLRSPDSNITTGYSYDLKVNEFNFKIAP